MPERAGRDAWWLRATPESSWDRLNDTDPKRRSQTRGYFSTAKPLADAAWPPRRLPPTASPRHWLERAGPGLTIGARSTLYSCGCVRSTAPLSNALPCRDRPSIPLETNSNSSGSPALRADSVRAESDRYWRRSVAVAAFCLTPSRRRTVVALVRPRQRAPPWRLPATCKLSNRAASWSAVYPWRAASSDSATHRRPAPPLQHGFQPRRTSQGRSRPVGPACAWNLPLVLRTPLPPLKYRK